MTKHLLITAAILGSLWSSSCTKKDSDKSSEQVQASQSGKCDKATEALPKLEWEIPLFAKLHSFYKEYGSCLQGNTLTETQTTIMGMLNKRWNELPQFAELAKQDPSFKDFVLKNINTSATGLTLEAGKIITFAKSNCPKGLESLCSEIKARCEKELAAEIKEIEESPADPKPAF